MTRRHENDSLLIGWGDDQVAASALLAAGETHVLVTAGVASGVDAFVDAVGALAHTPGHVVFRISCDRSMRAVPLSGVAAWCAAGDAESVVAAVHVLAGPGSLIRVDRAHHLDDESAVVVARAARHGARLLLTAARHRPLPPALVALEADALLAHVALPDLDDADVSRLAADVLGGPVEPGLVRAVTTLVGWAPAAAADVLRDARDSGAVTRSGRMWRQIGPLTMTPWVLAQVDDVVGGLDDERLDALDMIAIAGSVPWTLARATVRAETLEQLERLGLVEVTGSMPAGFVRVVERVVRSARRQALLASRSARLAERLADAYRPWAAARDELETPDRVLGVRLALAAGHTLDPHDALEASRAAQASGDLSLSEEICRAALRATPTIDVRLALADLLTATGRAGEVEQLFGDVRPATDAEVALVAMARAVSLGMHLDRVDEAIDVLEAARRTVDDEQWAAELIGVGGVFDLMLGRPDQALATTAPHLEQGHGRRFVEAATAAGPALVMVGRHLEAMDVSQRAFDERLALGEQPVLIGPGLHLLVRSLACAEAGLLAEAEALAELVTSAASSIGSNEGRMWGGVIGGRGLLNQGRFNEARVAFDNAAAAAMDLNLVLHLGWARGGSLLAAAQTGDATVVRQCLDALDAVPTTRLALMASELDRARGWAAMALGDLRRAITSLETAADLAAASGQPGLEIIAVHDLLRIGVRQAAPRLAEVGARVQGDLAAARMAHGEGVRSDDHDALLDASERFEALGALVMAAEAATHAAWTARRRGRAGRADEAQARAMRLRAMRPEAATPGLAAHPGFAMLTEREREVVELAAAGESSKAIAATLELSVRTVDNLLQRAYRKLAVSGRNDLRSLRTR